MTVKSTLSVIAPQFDTFDSDLIDSAISIATRQMSPSTWGELFEDGAANLVAHILTVREREKAAVEGGAFGVTGAVNSIKTGGLALRFGAVGAATASNDEASLKTTPFGLEYLRLRHMLAHQPLVLVGIG